jgi:Ser/Thr protein kinase RdoA (MazF antagonist)
MSGSPDTADPAADLLSAVAQAYGLTAPFHAKRLSGGYANDVFLLDGERPVVLHVKHPPVDLNSLTWEHQLLKEQRIRLPEIPVPLPTQDGRTLPTQDGRTFLLHQQRPVRLTPYVLGAPAAPSDRCAVAAALGSLHSIKIDITARPGHPRLSDLPIPQISLAPSHHTRTGRGAPCLYYASSAFLRCSARPWIGILSGIIS